LLGSARLIHAQATDSPVRFESATIKAGENTELGSRRPLAGRASSRRLQCTGGPGTHDPGLLKCNMTLAHLLGHAYRLGAAQFTAPIWMETTWFKIEAKVPAGATLEQVRSMEQNLLADRFKLAAHFARQDVAAYEMTVTKGGPKFKAVAKEADGGEMSGSGSGSLDGPHSMEQLASFLSFFMDWPVVDATGLAGVYDIELRFGAPTPWQAGPPGLALPRGPAPIGAVRDQLGLILELTKSPIDVLVIDHVEKEPTAGR
jgi:uncharacterized protein (TIGR03435 family)